MKKFILYISFVNICMAAHVGGCYHESEYEFMIPKDNWVKIVKVGTRNYLMKKYDLESKKLETSERAIEYFDQLYIEGDCPSFLKGAK